MKITIEIETVNSAFSLDRDGEILRISAIALSQVYFDRDNDLSLRDFNGNNVGKIEVEL